MRTAGRLAGAPGIRGLASRAQTRSWEASGILRRYPTVSHARHLSSNGSKTPPVENNAPSSAFVPPLRVHVSFDDFLKADTNRDGRVTAAEWDNYCRSKQKHEKEPYLRGLTVHLPVPPSILRDMIDSDGFGITVNGLHYSLQLKPEGDTKTLIKLAKKELEALNVKIADMEKIKAPLDAAAARHTRRVMTSILGYLILQAGVVAKLTFFSRFGWDIMEPITYFITFGISLVGLSFFTWNRLEFSYPALAALIARRKAEKLYRRNNFDEALFLAYQRERERIQRQLDALIPARHIPFFVDNE